MILIRFAHDIIYYREANIAAANINEVISPKANINEVLSP